MIHTFNLSVPKERLSLSDRQHLFFFSLLSQDRAMEENLTLCLFKWAGLLSFAILTARSSSDMIHRCISIKHDFYKVSASLSPPYQKTQDEWSCWTLTKSGSFEMFVYLRWMGWRCICSVSQEVSFFVIKSTFVFAWLILYICGFIEYVSGIF